LKNRFLILSIFLIVGLFPIRSYGQQRPVYSQYLFNALAINPAFAGSQDQFSATVLHRNQWVNFPGAPTINTLSANSPIANQKIGLGMMIVHDQVGVHSNFGLFLSYSYRIQFEKSALFLGLQAGFNNLKSDFGELNIKDIGDPNLSGALSKLNPNFGAGIHYQTSNFYAGFSAPHLLNNKIFDGEDVVALASERRDYFITAGRVFTINDELQIKPSTLIRLQEQAPMGIDINLQFIIKRLIALGTSYRSGDAVIFNFELQMNENFRIGYAYEWILSDLGDYVRGSHEIMINYRFDIPGLNKRLECPTYF